MLSPRDAQGRDLPLRRLGRIVVGVDFSEPSLAVAGWVGRHLAPRAELALVHVTSASRFPTIMRGPRDQIVTRADASAGEALALRGALRGLASLLGGARVTVEVRAGDPATELAAYADRMDADLVVVGANASYRVAAYYERAMTERLLQRTTRPVLIARNVRPSAPATLLAALAGDVDAPPVLSAAWMVARACEARVAALHVIDGPLRPGSEARVRRWLTASPIPPAKSAAIVAQGEKVRGIITAARQMGAEMIAIGARSSGGNGDDAGAGRDTGRDLARSASCSVLVVPYSADAATPPPGRWATASRGWRRRELHPRPPVSDHDGSPPPAAALPTSADAA